MSITTSKIVKNEEAKARKISFEKTPMMKEFRLCGETSDFLAKITEAGKVYLDVSPNSKTSLYSSLYIPGFSFGFNRYTEEYKFLSKSHYSFFTGKTTEQHFFKVLKKQGIIEYLKYILQSLKDIGIPIEIDLVIYETPVILKLQKDYEQKRIS